MAHITVASIQPSQQFCRESKLIDKMFPQKFGFIQVHLILLLSSSSFHRALAASPSGHCLELCKNNLQQHYYIHVFYNSSLHAILAKPCREIEQTRDTHPQIMHHYPSPKLPSTRSCISGVRKNRSSGFYSKK